MALENWTQSVARGSWMSAPGVGVIMQSFGGNTAFGLLVRGVAGASQAGLLAGSLSYQQFTRTGVTNTANGDAGVAFMMETQNAFSGTYYTMLVRNYFNNFALKKQVNGVEGTLWNFGEVGVNSGMSFGANYRVTWIADPVRFGGTYINVLVTAIAPASGTILSWEIIDINAPIVTTTGQGLFFKGDGAGGGNPVSSNLWANVSLDVLSAVASSVS